MQQQPRNHEQPLTRRRVVALLGLGTAGVALAACAGGEPAQRASEPGEVPTTSTGPPDYAARFQQYEPAEEPNGDLGKVIWPAFILQAGGDIKQLYEFQVQNGDLMRYMPCFCGCQWEDGHRNNRDCYIERVNSDGSVVFDTMAPT